MSNFKQYLFIYFLSFLLASCGQKKVAKTFVIINIERDDSVKFEKYFSNIKIIPLQSSSQNTIAEPIKTVVHNDRIYILDNKHNGVSIFDTLGRYVKKIQHKNIVGSAKYSTIQDFEINEFSNTLELLTTNKFIEYSYEGEFISESFIPLGDIKAVSFFKPVTKDIVVFYSRFEFNRISYFSRQKKSIIKKGHPVPEFVARKSFMNDSSSPFFLNEKKQIIFHEPFSNDIAMITGSDDSLLYSWDFGKHNFKLDEQFSVDKTHSFYEDYLMRDTIHAFYFRFNVENEKFSATTVGYKRKGKTIIYNKNDHNYVVFNRFINKLTFPIPINGTSDDVIYAIVEPSYVIHLKSELHKHSTNGSIIDSIHPTDNPIVLQYTLRK